VHEFSGQKLLDPATVPTDIVVSQMQLVGNYGLSIGFSDGHSTGIYRFDDLYENRPGRS
jgi:ATP-binding protein involved in chromosome partitioning